mgnify:CR=1 FL=1
MPRALAKIVLSVRITEAAKIALEAAARRQGTNSTAVIEAFCLSLAVPTPQAKPKGR